MYNTCTCPVNTQTEPHQTMTSLLHTISGSESYAATSRAVITVASHAAISRAVITVASHAATSRAVVTVASHATTSRAVVTVASHAATFRHRCDITHTVN